MEECSVLIETTKSAEDKTSRWFDLPIDYELFRDLLGVEADSKDYQITDMKLPFAGDIVRTTSVRRLNKLYFAYTDLSPEVQQAYKELIPYCGGKPMDCFNASMLQGSVNHAQHVSFSCSSRLITNTFISAISNTTCQSLNIPLLQRA